MNHNRHPRNGFTLVELLVVVTIIAVLAAIVFSAASRMRKSANQAVTTANMKQIGIGMLTFTADNGRFPSQLGDPVWDRAILGNLGFLDALNASGSIARSTFPQLESTAKIFTTPEDKEKRDPSVYQRSFAIVPWTTNWSNGTAFRGWKNLPLRKGIAYSTLTAPEKSAMVVQGFPWPWTARSPAPPPRSHNLKLSCPNAAENDLGKAVPKTTFVLKI